MGLLSKGGGLWNQMFSDIGGGMARLGTGINTTPDIYDAYVKAGYSPAQAGSMSSQWMAQREATPTNDYNSMANQGNQNVPMASGQAQGYVNPQATKQVAQGINSGYSLLGQSKLPATGSMWEQIGGFFQDRPALTEGLLTTGIGLGAGLGGQAFAVGGQAMQNRQTSMAAAEEKRYSRGMEANKFELDTLKANADILKAINEGGGNTSYKAALDEAVKSGLEGPEAQRYAMFKQAGITPPLTTKGHGGWLGGILGKKYTAVAK
jgi:hypothetical protein